MQQPSIATQPRLFSLPVSARASSRSVARKLDIDSEELLERYGRRRLASGGTARTVARETSQLRSLARGVVEGETSGPIGLRSAFADARVVARALLEPATPISWSTGRARLVAAQRFSRECCRELGIDPVTFLHTLDELLPARSSREWHSSGTIVSGIRTRRRPICPTLYPQDLERIVAGVAASDSFRLLRDRALVALHCLSGLRPEEIVRLRVEDVTAGNRSEGTTLSTIRAGRMMRVPLPEPGLGWLVAFVRLATSASAEPTAYLFRRGNSDDRPLTPRAARVIVQRACAQAGFPLASAADLRATFAYSLRLRGLSDHETAAVLGFRRVRTLDRLLARHKALDAQRRVQEMLS
jgi:integrase